MAKEKTVFISHSSIDHPFANRLCELFEQNDISCWIAPRDIPFGNVWSSEIADAIRGSKLMIFIYSDNSNKSTQVLREITLAEQNGVRIIAVRVSDSTCNDALNYYLSIYHWVSIKESAADDELQAFVHQVKTSISGGGSDEAGVKAANLDVQSEEEFFDVDINIDDELEAKFEDMFSSKATAAGQESEVSPFRKRLLDRIVENYNETFFPEREGELVDDEESDNDEESDKEDASRRYFRSSEKEGASLAFVVRRVISEDAFQEHYVAEELEKELTTDKNGDPVAEHYIQDPDYEGNPLILLTFPKGKNIAMTNMGFYSEQTVRISNKPEIMEFKSLSKKLIGKTAKYPVNEYSDKIIVDPETCTVVPRKKQYSKLLKKWMHYIEIVPHKKYFAFSLRGEKKGGTRAVMEANPFYIGYGYYKGRYGLKKNILSAAEWFEKSGTKDGYLHLARIFTEDPLLANEEDAAYYRKLAETAEES